MHLDLRSINFFFLAISHKTLFYYFGGIYTSDILISMCLRPHDTVILKPLCVDDMRPLPGTVHYGINRIYFYIWLLQLNVQLHSPKSKSTHTLASDQWDSNSCHS